MNENINSRKETQRVLLTSDTAIPSTAAEESAQPHHSNGCQLARWLSVGHLFIGVDQASHGFGVADAHGLYLPVLWP